MGNYDEALTVTSGGVDISSADFKDFEAGDYGEMRADITLNGNKVIRLWGVVSFNENAQKVPVPFALLKLIKVCNNTSTSVAHTVADANGYYQFDVCPEQGCSYKVLASKPNTSNEYVLKPTAPPQNGYTPCTTPPIQN